MWTSAKEVNYLQSKEGLVYVKVGFLEGFAKPVMIL